MKESIVTADMFSQIVSSGLFIATVSLMFYLFDLPNKETLMFAFFIFAIIFNGFNARTEKINLFEHIGENKKFIIVMGIIFIIQIIMITFGGSLLRTVPLSLVEWLFITLSSFVIILSDLIRKVLIKWKLQS